MSDFQGLEFLQDDNRLVASVRPIAEHQSLDCARLQGLLAEAGYGNWRIADEALATLVERYNTATAEFELTLGESRAASFSLEIAADSMQVWLNMIPASGGQALEPDEIYIRLGEAGVTFGIDQAAVSSACVASDAVRVLVAAGVPAEHGDNARFDLLVADARDRAPQVDEHGLIDFREQGAIPTVSADQPLMRRIPPTTGVAGRNVLGQIIEPVPGSNDAFADRLIGAYVSRDDANLLRAVFSGQPVRCGNGVNVEAVFHIRDVNMATGNITFDGTVNIDGEVLPGMKVHATGDIVVGGVVDGAELEAGGDIRVGGGIIAKSHVRAGGAVAARFVESAHVLAGTTIAIDDTALQSDLQANNQIIVGLKSPQRGRLAGGSARAMMLIHTPILGSSTGGVTSLLLGVNPVLDAKYQELLHKIEKVREEEGNLDKLVKHLSKSGDKAVMLERVKASWQQVVKTWATLMAERDDIERQLALIAGARTEVGISVAGAVDMAFGKKLVHVRKNYECGTFSIDTDRVVFTDPAGNVTPAG